MAITNLRPNIHYMHAVGIVAVVLHHLCTPFMPGGYIGADMFFVISGYLITQNISREIKEGTLTFARFYKQQAQRRLTSVGMIFVTNCFFPLHNHELIRQCDGQSGGDK